MTGICEVCEDTRVELSSEELQRLGRFMCPTCLVLSTRGDTDAEIRKGFEEQQKNALNIPKDTEEKEAESGEEEESGPEEDEEEKEKAFSCPKCGFQTVVFDCAFTARVTFDGKQVVDFDDDGDEEDSSDEDYDYSSQEIQDWIDEERGSGSCKNCRYGYDYEEWKNDGKKIKE